MSKSKKTISDHQTMVFGYVRVSTENQLENYSIDEQVQRIESYCKAKGWVLLKIYTDGGYSGGNTDRPALQQMLQAIKENSIDAVVVYKLDRLSRSQKDTLTLIEDEFLSHDTDFVSINENFDTSTPFGRAMIGILSVFAQLEKDQITERFTMGRIGRSKAGYFHGGGNIPFGYLYTDGELVVDEYKAAIVREIFDSFLNGESINSIWHKMEVKYPGKWSAPKIQVILKNSTYTGKVKFAGVEYDGKHTPIISAETYHSANQLLNSAERKGSQHTSQKTPFRAGYLLSSLIYCRKCGARYSANHGFYRCYSRAKSSKKFIVDPNCKNDHWEIEKLDGDVVKEIREILSNEETFSKALSTAPKNEHKVDTAAIEKRIHAIAAQIDKLVDLYQISAIPIETLSTRVQDLSTEKNILLSQLESSSLTRDNPVVQFSENARRFKTDFDRSPLSTRRLLVSSLISRIWIDGPNFSIEWRI